jgi:hypothetical protein
MWLRSLLRFVTSGCDLLPMDFWRISGTLLGYFEFYGAFDVSYLIAHTAIVSLGWTVDTNAHVFLHML